MSIFEIFIVQFLPVRHFGPTENPHKALGLSGMSTEQSVNHDAVARQDMVCEYGRIPSNTSEKTLGGVEGEGDAQYGLHPESKVIDVVPDGGYGWVCVGCVFLINGHTWGLSFRPRLSVFSFL